MASEPMTSALIFGFLVFSFVKYCGDHKELLERLSRIEKHLGLEPSDKE